MRVEVHRHGEGLEVAIHARDRRFTCALPTDPPTGALRDMAAVAEALLDLPQGELLEELVDAVFERLTRVALGEETG